MSNKNLSILFDIQKLLQELKYPDYKRVSLEIFDFIKADKIPIDDLFQRLRLDEPWEYIRGYCEFCGFDFQVTKDTLIPRIETEQIVYTALDILNNEDIQNIVDVGTGSGCIPISIAKLSNFSKHIYATDISSEAINVAQNNEKRILKTKKIDWLRTNLIHDLNISGRTLFTANLPYIPTTQYKQLSKSVLNYEPQLALNGGDTGLLIYEEFFKQVISKNIDTKYIILETEESIFKNTIALAKRYFEKSKISELTDIYGRRRFLLVSFL